MRLGTTTVRKLAAEVDAAVEAQAAVVFNVDVQGVEVGRGVDEADLAGLHEVVGDSDVLLVGGHLDVVGADGGLVLIGVVEALDVVEVADVQGRDVVGGRQGQVNVFAVLGDISAGLVSIRSLIMV